MFVSTQHNMVYGFDADAFGSAPMWSRSLGAPTDSTDISTVRYCSDIPYEQARTHARTPMPPRADMLEGKPVHVHRLCNGTQACQASAVPCASACHPARLPALLRAHAPQLGSCCKCQ